MKILFALSRFPYPTDKGDKLRAYYQLKWLGQRHDLYLVCLAGEEPSREDLAHINSFCKKVVVVRKGLFRRVWDLVCGFFSLMPFQVHYFASPEMKRTISTLVNEEKIDICYVQLVRLLKNIPENLPVKYYLDYMDALSEGMRKRYLASSWYEKLPVWIEYRRLKKCEASVLDDFDRFSIISEPDAQVIAVKKALDVIPNGVNEAFFTDRKESKDFHLIFTGNMSYHPNVLACKFLVKEVLPLLAKGEVYVKVCLAGTNPSPEVKALQSEQVIVTGYVEDMVGYLCRSMIFVAPLFTGSGLQNKLLESMAVGLPVVTTPLANSALQANPGQQVVIAKDAQGFADSIIELLHNEEEREKIGLQGKAFIQKQYNWDDCNRKLENAFYNLLKQ
ncbi:glycosyltransferase [Cytophagaceae bacterium ABcell3]|nr:glycosyltransferase [Cytophagaceae bacterium ABcell3]